VRERGETNPERCGFCERMKFYLTKREREKTEKKSNSFLLGKKKEIFEWEFLIAIAWKDT